MRKIIIIPIFLMVSSMGSLVMGQSPEALQKIRSARIALITTRLDLTPEQAEKFWPLYNEYTEKREALRDEYIKERASVKRESITEEQSSRLLDMGLEIKEKQLELDRIYSARLTKVISSTQLLELRHAEEEFKRMILERLERRMEMRERMENRQERRRN